jgi:hypothetical protein
MGVRGFSSRLSVNVRRSVSDDFSRGSSIFHGVSQRYRHSRVLYWSSFTRGRNYLGSMKLYGSLLENLESALTSGRRLRGQPVYKDTLNYWAELVQEARRALQDSSSAQSDALGAVIVELETELAERSS